jgi:hypothetical protein
VDILVVGTTGAALAAKAETTTIPIVSVSVEKDTRTCRVRTNPWQETFTRSLGGKWVSNRGPSGDCSVVIVSTLEPEDPKEPPSENALWTYSWKAKEFDRSCAFVEFEMQ